MNTDIQRRVEMLETRLEVKFKNKALLVQALTHRSYLNEHRSHFTGHNERLEFLGDAVIEIIVTELLYKTYPDETEGTLTAYRGALVCADTLGSLWESLGLYDALLLSKGEARPGKTNAKARKHLCANAFEAVIGALHLDQGIGECRFVLDHLLIKNMESIITSKQDEKGLLQEMIQAKFGVTPEYRVLLAEGPDHAKVFLIGCFIADALVAEARGDSLKEAQVVAAIRARETMSQWEGRIAEVCQKVS